MGILELKYKVSKLNFFWMVLSINQSMQEKNSEMKERAIETIHIDTQRERGREEN